MSALNKGKHVVEELNGVRCTIVEKGITESRMSFLKHLLEQNNLIVQVSEEAENKFTIGVTNLIFNPIIAVYERILKNQTGEIVTPAYWNQLTEKCDSHYWRYR